ncbi:hypothetical protein ACFQPF_06975 [Fictibacillus iocasae]|uniref:Uncharacterized protein n=1 Tax=Fictibacillus iocasae TaxID=2715437 RepID=A0ABW2NQB9_9BACL
MEKKITKKENGNEYIEGTYRLWKNPNGGIAIKFDKESELYTIPKNSDLHKRIGERFNI